MSHHYQNAESSMQEVRSSTDVNHISKTNAESTHPHSIQQANP
jgi:hypothetical protein